MQRYCTTFCIKNNPLPKREGLKRLFFCQSCVKVVTKEVFDKVTGGLKGTFDKIKEITDLIFGGEE